MNENATEAVKMQRHEYPAPVGHAGRGQSRLLIVLPLAVPTPQNNTQALHRPPNQVHRPSTSMEAAVALVAQVVIVSKEEYQAVLII